MPVETTIPKYYIAEVLSSSSFILPISILYLQSFSITYTQLGTLECINAAVILLFEVPTGVFADFFGRKLSTVLGRLFWAAALVSIGVGGSFSLFLVAYLIWGIGETFVSGASTALIYDTLKQIHREDDFLKIKGNTLLLTSASVILGSIAGAYLYQVNKRMPWLLFGLTYLLAALVTLTMEEPFHSDSETKSHYQHMRTSIQFSFSNKDVRFLIIFSVLSLIPLSVFTNLAEQPYLVHIGFSISRLGIIYALTRGVIGIASPFIFTIERRLGEKVSFFLVTAVYSAGFITLGLAAAPAVVVLVVLIYFSRDYQQALTETYINRHIPSFQRATVLSVKNLTVNACTTLYIVVGGVVLDILPLDSALLLFGVLTLVTTTPYLVSKYKKT